MLDDYRRACHWQAVSCSGAQSPEPRDADALAGCSDEYHHDFLPVGYDLIRHRNKRASALFAGDIEEAAHRWAGKTHYGGASRGDGLFKFKQSPPNKDIIRMPLCLYSNIFSLLVPRHPLRFCGVLQIVANAWQF